MLRFESFPPTPETTFITEEIIEKINAFDWDDSIETSNVRFHVVRGIASSLGLHGPNSYLSRDLGQDFYPSLAEQIPSNALGKRIKEELAHELRVSDV